jgi:hypothetical protein
MWEFNGVYVTNSLDNDFFEIETYRENEIISVYI